jgi:hypothetical protein
VIEDLKSLVRDPDLVSIREAKDYAQLFAVCRKTGAAARLTADQPGGPPYPREQVLESSR